MIIWNNFLLLKRKQYVLNNDNVGIINWTIIQILIMRKRNNSVRNALGNCGISNFHKLLK